MSGSMGLVGQVWVRTRQVFRASLLWVLPACARFAVAAFAFAAVTLNGLALAVVLISKASFEQLFSLVDRSPSLACMGTLLYAGPVAVSLVLDYRALEREEWQSGWQLRASRLAVIFSLLHLAADTAILRGPWLLGQASGFDRLTVWTARLSSAYGGVPVTAFALTLGFGAMIFCTTSAFIRAYGVYHSSEREIALRRIKVVAWILCVLVFVAGLAATSSFAAGGAV